MTAIRKLAAVNASVIACSGRVQKVDAAVIGLPDDEAGEIPVGYVVLRPAAAASPEEIMRFVAGEVAHYKQIRRLEVIDAIPKSAVGKILRRVLRDIATEARKA
jgi:acyl-coenzyme A synthetase/AMP-(fatty) acid ligase